jgi:hypothetical protein
MEVEKHTPTPWHVGERDRSDQRIIKGEHIEIATLWHHSVKSLYIEMEANAAFIVRACNSHDQLVTAMRDGRVAIDVLMARLIEVDPSFKPSESAVWPKLVAITSALAAAESA